MKFKDTLVLRDERFSIGIELESGRRYVSFPVSNGVVDYEEYYEVDSEEYERFLINPGEAAGFVDECRRHTRDDLLMMKPGKNRGTPI
ncbi:hypothetical protein O4215_21760 [Rhodococcus maanshanensis]|uniref:hypothetical protein n=1 Tax=Rhodococcus maanshanensis TaxID=183556 RepID=UPI0022B5A3EB|nr:hypothetical protein [Rhodococcus maanshanensis]MCZ4558192.1 hypothetical protein [Rhodococcus maanshanensis]